MSCSWLLHRDESVDRSRPRNTHRHGRNPTALVDRRPAKAEDIDRGWYRQLWCVDDLAEDLLHRRTGWCRHGRGRERHRRDLHALVVVDYAVVITVDPRSHRVSPGVR